MPYPVAAVRGRLWIPGDAAWWRAGGTPLPLWAYQPKCAASLAASYINLANPGAYDASAGTAPSFGTSTGWSFASGSSMYLFAGGVVPGRGWSMVVRFANSTTGTRYMLRATSTNYTFGFAPSYTGGNHYYYGGMATALQVAGALASGVMAVAGRQCYLNGVSEGEVPNSAEVTNTTQLLIGCNYNGSSRGNYWTGDMLAIAIWNSELSGAQVAAVSAAMALL